MVRRMSLNRTRYYLYYEIPDGRAQVTVLALWHMSRGKAPLL
jgi:hypothetical protein